MDRPDLLSSEPEKRHRERGSRGAARRSTKAREGIRELRAEREALLYDPTRESTAEIGNLRDHAPVHGVYSDLTQLGAQLRLEMVCYAAGSLRSIGEEWYYFEPERRFSLSLTWQYLVTGSLPALHRHYLLERMTREQCAGYEGFLKNLRRSRYVIERLGLFPPWRTLESVTAEAVLEREIPGKLARHSQASMPTGRRSDGRRKWSKRMADRLTGIPRKES